MRATRGNDLKICTACRQRYTSEDWRCTRCGQDAPRIDSFVALAPDLARASASGFQAHEFASLAAAEQGSFWFRGRNRLIQWALSRHCASARSFLEVGCGTGFVLHGIAAAFPDLELFASEVAVAGLPYAALRVPRAKLFQMDVTRVPFDREFDVVGAFDVLEHIEDDRMAIRGLLQALKPGGRLIVTVPQHMLLWSAEDVAARHFRRYGRIELQEKLTQAGFRVEFKTSFVFFLLPAMAGARLAVRKQAAGVQSTELRLPRPVDRAFEATLKAERALIAAGVHFPVGGSQLVVASRPI
jgi:SAM-dependent methyltransferase